MFRPVKSNFWENLVTEEYIYDKMLPKMCINKFNLQQYIVNGYEIYNYFPCFMFLYKSVVRLQTHIYVTADTSLPKRFISWWCLLMFIVGH